MKAGTVVLFRWGTQVGTLACSAYFFSQMVRSFGPAGYGAYVQVLAMTGALAPFAMMGLNHATVRFFSSGKWNSHVRKRFMTGMALAGLGGILAALVLWVFSGTLSRWFIHHPEGWEIMKWGSLAVIGECSFPLAMEGLRARQEIRAASVAQLSAGLAMVGVVWVARIADLSLPMCVLSLTATKLIVLLGMLGYLISVKEIEEAGTVSSSPSLGDMVRFGFPLSVMGMSSWLLSMGDRLVIGHFWDTADVGRYNAIFTLASLMVVGASGLTYQLYPRLMVSKERGDEKDFERDVEVFHRWISYLLIPMSIFLMVASSPILVFLGGQGFKADIRVVVLLVASVFIVQWNGALHYVLYAHNETAYITRISIGMAVANVLINILTVPRWGLLGAATTTLLTSLAGEILILLRVARFAAPARLYLSGEVWRSFLTAWASGVLFWFVFQECGSPAMGLLAGGAVFGGTFLVFSGAGDDLRSYLGRMGY